ncbi:galactokinase [Catellatospora sp. TT07R-123]|uniref:galactokinase n=1 Tax=Catellatospora sp. TT07R-123 TaxID=2733863 RepID=UPI001B0A7DAA|nr:galactokinase [Catellatospora sp. TT07R-123]GHJ50357.1 galactokinase [Catellatospora sp. TT07R-123]
MSAVDSGVWAAPGRVNLIGEHTDYCDGFVLPFALPHRTEVTAVRLDRPEWTVSSSLTGETVTFDLSEPVTGWAAYVAAVVWALRDAGYDVPGARLDIVSDVPGGAGLSSSAALECAVLSALADLGGLDLPVARRPKLAQRAENAYVGMPCGVMDQSASTLCREGHALFLDCRSMAVEHIPLDLAGQGLAILVIDSRAPHQLVDGEYAARRAACEKAAEILGVPALRDATLADLSRLDDPLLVRRARHIVTENDRVLSTIELLREGRVREIGPLLTASHASMRDDFEITVAEVDTAVETALAAGAYGARMTGGGFGGCVLALVDADRADTVAAAVTAAFAASGFGPPHCFPVTPAPGATRLS